MKKSLKQIISMVLISAILITSTITSSTATANAATTASYVQKWGTVTMKPGDTKNT